MCTQIEPAAPSSTAQALAMVRAGLGYLTACDAASLGTSAQAEALIGLEQTEAQIEGIGAGGCAGSSTHAPGPATVTTAARHLAVL